MARRKQDIPAKVRIFLAVPQLEDEEEFLSSVQRSQDLHRPWTFPPCTHEEYGAYLGQIREGRKIGFLLRRRTDRQPMGVINVSEPVMGVFRSAYLGFYAFAPHERQGYMSEGLALVLDRAFGELGFHRLEANVQPGNLASGAFVRRMGFRKEGFSPRYLRIDGDWRDHDRWAILNEEWNCGRRTGVGLQCQP